MNLRTSPRTVPLLTLAGVAGLASVASAEPVAAIVAPAAPPETAVDLDPNLDRGFLLPTAETQPAGSITFNSYELFIAGLTFGVTDDLQVSATVVPGLFGDTPTLIGSGKLRVLSTGRTRLAVHGSAMHQGAHEGDDSLFGAPTHDAVTAFTAGATLSLCTDDRCHSMLSATGAAVAGQSGDDGGIGALYGLSAVQRLTSHVKLLAELAGPASIDPEAAHLLSAGFRLHGRRFATDLGAIVAVDSLDLEEDVVLLPFVNLTYRWN